MLEGAPGGAWFIVVDMVKDVAKRSFVKRSGNGSNSSKPGTSSTAHGKNLVHELSCFASVVQALQTKPDHEQVAEFIKQAAAVVSS